MPGHSACLAVQNRRGHRSILAVISAPADVLDNTVENPWVSLRTAVLDSANADQRERRAVRRSTGAWSSPASYVVLSRSACAHVLSRGVALT
jgi:hypothetical protein